jgi:surfactin synthase thioesterase subunit
MPSVKLLTITVGTWLAVGLAPVVVPGGELTDAGVATASSRAAQAPGLTLVSSPPTGHWAQYRLDDHSVDVYLAHDALPKPVVLLLQGSGCAPLMTAEPDGTLEDSSLFQDLVGPRLNALHFALIEKRGIPPLRFSGDMSQQAKTSAFKEAEEHCTADYLRNATKQTRVEDVVETMHALTRQPWARQIILVGHSEGTHVVTGVLRVTNASEVTAAALFASAGPIPFFGGYVARGAGDRAQFQSTFDEIRMLQRQDDDFIYQGLPVRRWKTFWLDGTPVDDVRASVVPLFVAQGTRDGSTLPADLFALEAIRQQPGRPLRYVVLDQGDHAFETPGGHSRLADLLDDFIRWALDDNRKTGLDVIK